MPANRLTMNRTRATTNRGWAIPAAVEAMPANPKTAATSATTRNINDQYNMGLLLPRRRDWRTDNASRSSRFRTVAIDHLRPRGKCRHAGATVPSSRRSLPLSPPCPPTEAPMQRELTPVESRGGVVSGRVLLVLVASFIGALIALGLSWAFLFPH